jgi:hypothetical protein
MYEGSCHCGAVQFVLTEAPEKLVNCNCSICHRIAALWGHVPIRSVTIIAAPGVTIEYIQGDKTLAIHTCKTCGCTTHWENLQPDGERMAVNFRMCAPEVISAIQIRRFDGADTWQFMD